MSGTWPRALHVVVPCRDEAASLGAHLAALTAAVDHAAARVPVEVTATVVLDRCRDGSAVVVRRHLRGRPWLHAVEVDRGRVGAVRADGVAHARRLSSCAAEDTWLACTDSDSEVPPDWLVHQAEVARAGHDVWLGTVRPAASPDTLRAWAAHHHLGPGHRHVHGANLGLRLSAYDAVGGFRPVVTDEDVALVADLAAHGARIASDDDAPVLTSARLLGRAPKGFAAFLVEHRLVGG